MRVPQLLHWRETAINDLTRIGQRVAVANPASADKRLDQITAKVELLAAYPELGHLGTKPGTRELVVHVHYLVIYRVQRDGVHLLRIKHSARKRPA
ncbi:type II toxin-antitoxin system RelE/ParE family toxin [Duganella sp.]|uniref:type II toxin-antitoxin system RelE/ParE family toxin n=1 Tax=Duganella sp. TaxID=1904440 RepID=UPI0031D3D869